MFPGLFPLFCALVFTSVPHDVEAHREVLLTPTDADDKASETEEVAKSFGECWVLWLDKHLGPTSAEPDAETLLQINRDCSAANHQDVLTALFGLRRTWARRSGWQCGDCDAKCLTDVCAHVRGIVAVDDDEVPVVGGSATGIAVDDDEVPVVGGSATGIAVDDDEVPVIGGSATGIAVDDDEVPVMGGSATGIAVDVDEVPVVGGSATGIAVDDDEGLIGPRHPAWRGGGMPTSLPGRSDGGMLPRFDVIGPGNGDPNPGLIGPRHPAWRGGGMPTSLPGRSDGRMLPRFDVIGPGNGDPNPDHMPVHFTPGNFPAFQGGASGRGRMDPDGMFML